MDTIVTSSALTALRVKERGGTGKAGQDAGTKGETGKGKGSEGGQGESQRGTESG